MTTRTFDFPSPTGYTLSGRLELPDPPVRGWALIAHCFTCGKDGLAAARIARALARSGIGALRFDFAGLGTSGGAFADATFGADVRDLVAAADAMSTAGMPPSLLIGHSLGGAAALAAAGDIDGIAAVVTIAAPFDVRQVLDQFSPGALERIAADGEAEVLLADRPFVVRKTFVDDLDRHDLGARIAALRLPLLILHAPLDATVDIDNATRIFVAAKHPKSFVSLDDADHLLTRQQDVDFAAKVIAAWSSRYLPAVPETREAGQEGDVVAEETRAGKYQVAIRAGGIRFLADEPASVGGLGSGPTPYDLVAAGLAACTTMTLRMYAELKGLPVERIRTAVGHGKQKDQAKPDLFTRTIGIDGDLDAAQRARLVDIANRCPVHRTLEGAARVDTSLGEPPAAAEPVEAHAQRMGEAIEGR